MSIRILLYETKASDWEEQKDQVLDKTSAIYYG